MSYVSGFMMGTAIVNGIRQAFSGGGLSAAQTQLPVLPAFACVSAQPGRKRYRAAALSTELAELLEKKLREIPYVRTVQANPVTGSILLTYDENAEEKISALEKELAERVFGISSAASQNCAKQAPKHGAKRCAHAMQPGAFGASIRRTARHFSNWIREATGGMLDLSTAVSLIFLARGIWSFLLAPCWPSAPQLIWWSMNLMRGRIA